MKFYKEVEHLTKEELKKRLQERKQEVEKESSSYKEDIHEIGYLVDCNQRPPILLEEPENNDFFMDVNCCYKGYIPPMTRVIYGFRYDYTHRISNVGRFYDLDTEDYIEEFFEDLRGIPVYNEFELFDFILEYLQSYFGRFPTIERNKKFQLIIKDPEENSFYEPTQPHNISSFRRDGSAMCTEFSILAQNLLTIAGVKSYLFFGHIKKDGEKGGLHAFNLVEFEEDETKEIMRGLLDYSEYVYVYNEHYHIIGESPFFGEIPELTENFIKELKTGRPHMTFQEYHYILFGSHYGRLILDKTRDYCLSTIITPNLEDSVNQTKKYVKIDSNL